MPNVIFFYRIARFLFRRKIPILPDIIKGIIFVLYNCNISYRASIGKNSEFLHKGMATLILDNVIIGENCRIGMNVLIVGKGPYKNVPKIGNNVWIGPGAILQGPLIIEDNVVIAPNAVVNNSIPKNMIVGGIPAKIIGNISELDYDIFKNESYKDGFAQFLEDKRKK